LGCGRSHFNIKILKQKTARGAAIRDGGSRAVLSDLFYTSIVLQITLMSWGTAWFLKKRFT